MFKYKHVRDFLGSDKLILENKSYSHFHMVFHTRYLKFIAKGNQVKCSVLFSFTMLYEAVISQPHC